MSGEAGDVDFDCLRISRNYLTHEENEACDHLDSELGKLIRWCLLDSAEEFQIAHATFILRAITNNPDMEHDLTQLFISVLRSTVDVQLLLEALRKTSGELGDEVSSVLCTTLEHSPIPIHEAVQIVQRLNSFSRTPEVIPILDGLMRRSLRGDYRRACEMLAHDVSQGAVQVPVDGVGDELRALADRFTQLPFPLAPDKLEHIIAQFAAIEQLCGHLRDLGMGDVVARCLEIQSKDKIDERDRLQLIALARFAILIKFRLYLHPTQVLAVLGQLCFPQGCFAQVKTGEGKSMIVTLLAFVLTMEKNRVHIISSSHALAERDQKHFDEFFRLFGVTTSSIDQHSPEEQYQSHILYGTATDFEFAVMREMLDRTSLFPPSSDLEAEKRFDCVIVDEVDNLTIDTALNGARLASMAETTYDWVYGPILRFVQQRVPQVDNELPVGMVAALREALGQEMGGRFQARLGDVSDKMLSRWLQSAHHALFKLHENHDYIIKGDRVLIVDSVNTGRIMRGSRWSHGIHEFVEVKHGLPVEKESINPISLSHPVYYPMYRSIFGFTGTMGSQHERDEVREIYGAESFDVPTYRLPRRIDAPPIIYPTDEIHALNIIAAITQCRAKGRPILVLCATIQDSLDLQAQLEARRIPHEMLNEVQERKEEEILVNAGLPGAVTIATNTAGRGTDIKLQGESEANGGLHVLLTSFPESLRVEEQAKGRAGRQGQRGSSAMLLSSQKLGLEAVPLGDDDPIAALYQRREEKVELMKDYHIFQARIDRFRFRLAQGFFRRLETFHRIMKQGYSVLDKRLATKRILNPVEPQFDALNPRDIPIARLVFALMTRPMDEEQSPRLTWESVVQQAVERIHNYLINDWAVHFYQPSEKFINREELNKALQAQRTFQQLQPILGAFLAAGIDEVFRESQEQLEAFFEKKLADWDEHLAPTGQGVLQFLQSIRRGRRSPLDLMASAL